MGSKRLLLLGVLACLAGESALAAPLSDARTAARGGTGIAIGDLRSITLNPANLATAPDAAFSFNLAAGAFAADKDELLDDIDQIQDDLDLLQSAIDNSDPSAAGLATLVKQDLKNMNAKNVDLEGGASFVLAIPTKTLGVALFSKARLQAAAGFVWDSGDDTVIDNAVSGGSLDQSLLNSYMSAFGVAVGDIGLTFAKASESSLGRLDIGTNVKYQRVLLAGKNMKVADYDTGDVFDRDRDTRESNHLNLDVGVTQHLGESHWLLAAVAENLLPSTTRLSTPFANASYKVAPQLTLGGAFDNGWFRMEANVEALKNEGFDRVAQTQFARIGFEIGHAKSVQLRVGGVHDLKDNQEDLLTAGIGISPFDVLNIDIAGMTGSDRTYGAMISIGLKI